MTMTGDGEVDMTNNKERRAVSLRPTDTPEQAKVIGAPLHEDMLVVAGAGSGKTYTMTRRIIDLIRRGVPAEKILGLTFTRKAASELLGRVSAAVAADADTGNGGGAALFLKPEVLTYDAFFQQLVRRYGLLVGFDQSTQPLSDAGARQLAVAVVDEHMDGLDPADFGSFNTLVNKVLSLSDAIGSSMIGDDCTSITEAISRIRTYDTSFNAAFSGFFESFSENYLDGEPLPQSAPKEPKPPKKRANESEEAYEGRFKAYERQRYVYAAFEIKDKQEVVRKREVLLGLVEAFNERKRQLDMAQFNDFTVAAYALVVRFPSIGEKVRRQYTHVLLDEYQDTSTTQAQLIAALFHPDQAGAGRSAVNAVGDPFQSIYAWRGASPGAFRLFIRDFGLPQSYRPYALSVTRRNSRVVLEAANNLTEPLRLDRGWHGDVTAREVEVAPLVPMEDAPEGTLGVLGFQTLGQEIDAVARFAKEAIKRHTPTSEEDDHKPHVAVLFRSKGNMAQFAQGLEDFGLSTATVGYSAMLERPDVRDVLALLHVVADHTDSASLMRLLATPRFGVGARDLRRLASLATERNDDYRLRALAVAGLVSKDAGHAKRSEVLRKYRDTVPNMVYLADLMTDSKLETIIARATGFSPEGAAAIVQAGKAIGAVQAVMNHALPSVLRAAVEALGLDVDTVVAQVMHHQGEPVNLTLAHSAFDALSGLVDTYTSEIAENQTPTLRGFVGWVDSLSEIKDDSQASATDPVDVVLMTIHQAKGLEWDAVAVVGLKKGTFPSNQGDRLAIDADEEHMGGMRDGHWVPPQYHEDASTWLDDPAAVPAPVRADSDILPDFLGHVGSETASDADGEVPGGSGNAIDLAAQMLHDVAGERELAGLDSACDYPTPHEEYGRRLHADERRLAYVALTRARHDVLLTYSERTDSSRYIAQPQKSGRVSKPSNFWIETLDSMVGHRHAVVANNAVEELETSSVDLGMGEVAGRTLAELGAPAPKGLFVGSHAQEYCSSVVVQAWTDCLENEEEKVDLAWPAAMSSAVGAPLGWAAEQVREAQSRMDREQVSDGNVRDDGDAGSHMQYGVAVADSDTLLARAQMVVEDRDLMPWHVNSGYNAAAGSGMGSRQQSQRARRNLDSDVRQRGERLLRHRRQNVTDLQARTGHLDKHQAEEYWRGLIRPIPSVSSPAAQAGTQFHAWAERFVNAYDSLSAGLGEEASSGEGVSVAVERAVESRESMLADLQERQNRPTSEKTADERHIETWERRLADSRWATRRPFAAERQIVVSVPQLNGEIINGKLDAVFYGRLDGADSIRVDADSVDHPQRFTIVDWKTGRKPTQPDDVERKLAQLDMYRLLLSASEGVPLEHIDATLYYVSESTEADREIHARPKTLEEILEQLGSGMAAELCEDHDND